MYAAFAARLAVVSVFYGLATLSIIIGALLCYRQERPSFARSAADFGAFIVPRPVLFHPSARLDLWFALVRWLTRPFFIAPFVFSAVAAGKWLARILTLALGSPEPTGAPPLAASLLLTAALFVATDFARFFAHYLAHRVPALWKFHKVHHSAEVLIPATALRAHPLDEVLIFLAIASANTLVYAAFFYLYPMGISEVTILGMGVYLLFYLLTFYPLRHSHLPLRFGRALERVLISPAMHQLHHSVDPRHRCKNLGFAFTLWDRLLGTVAWPEPKAIGPLGLGKDDDRSYRTVWSLYVTPFVELFRSCGVPLGARLGRSISLGARRVGAMR